MQKIKVKFFEVHSFHVVMKDKTYIKTVLCKNCVKFDPAHHVCISFKYETLNFTHVKCAYRLGNLNCNLILEAEAETCISECFHSFVHSFIHCRHLYSASTSGTTQKCYQPQHSQIMLF